MDEESIDYPRMLRDALRGVVWRVLVQVAEEGLPGEHALYIGFHTGDPGVRMPKFLHDLHPEEMTVVLEHQFWDLEVDEEAFSVSLTFGGARQRLTVPFAAVASFADPAASFGLRFDGAAGEGVEGDEEPAAEAGAETAAAAPQAGNVVSIDRFRDKK